MNKNTRFRIVPPQWAEGSGGEGCTAEGGRQKVEVSLNMLVL